MNKNEMTDIINRIANTYPSFMYGRDLKEVCRSWYGVMETQSYASVDRKLAKWIIENERPPLPCNLVTIDWRKEYEQ